LVTPPFFFFLHRLRPRGAQTVFFFRFFPPPPVSPVAEKLSWVDVSIPLLFFLPRCRSGLISTVFFDQQRLFWSQAQVSGNPTCFPPRSLWLDLSPDTAAAISFNLPSLPSPHPPCSRPLLGTNFPSYFTLSRFVPLPFLLSFPPNLGGRPINRQF